MLLLSLSALFCFCRYVNVDEETGTELFYYFVESERSPDTGPVLLWLTGGAGCSSLIFYEVGETLIVRSSCLCGCIS